MFARKETDTTYRFSNPLAHSGEHVLFFFSEEQFLMLKR